MTTSAIFPVFYSVDEAGDCALWGRRGKLLVGQEGCSKHFIMGLARVGDPISLGKALMELRYELLADPYFQDVPSMQPGARKTALFFHAKDDVPEVRREVFKLLLSQDVEFHAVVRNKLTVANSITEFRKLRTYKYDENHFYDQMVRRLLKDKLHTDANLSYSVTFASRGNSDRTAALRTALEAARDSWCKEEGLENSQKPILVKAVASHKDAGLQAVDYFLWALQRTYERREDRYIKLLWSKCKCVWDCDDTRDGSGGIRYTKEKPLTAAFLPGI